MSEFKGTKGKWKLHMHAFACVVSDESSLLVSNCGGRTSNVNADQLYIEQQANAQLIAHAPEMLEMLKEVLAGRICPREYQSDSDMVNELIESATTL